MIQLKSVFSACLCKNNFSTASWKQRMQKYLLHNSASLKSNKRLAECFHMLSHLFLIELFIRNYDFLYILQLRYNTDTSKLSFELGTFNTLLKM